MWVFVLVFVSLLTVVALATVALTARTRPINDDAGQMLYLAWTMDALGYLPYRDFLHENMPFAFLAFQFSGRVFGFSPDGARLADLAWTGASLVGVAFVVAPAGRVAVLFALGALTLLQAEPIFLLRRETVALPALLCAVAALGGGRLPRQAAALVAGLGAGLAVTVRPQFVTAVAAFAFWIVWRRPQTETIGATVRHLAWLTVGVAIPLLLTGAYLLATGTWAAFADVVTDYWPLYAAFNYGPLGRTWKQSLGFPVIYALGSGHAWWVVAAAMGLVTAWRRGGPLRDRAVLLGALLVAFAAYPALGHNWPNHWMPFLYVAVPLSSLAFAAIARRMPLGSIAAALTVTVIAFTQLHASDELVSRVAVNGPSYDEAELDNVARWLRERGGGRLTVQPIDWVDGEYTVMLMAEVQLGTSNPFPLMALTFPAAAQARWWGQWVEEFNQRRPALVILPHWMHLDISRNARNWTASVTPLLQDYRPALITTRRVIYERIP